MIFAVTRVAPESAAFASALSLYSIMRKFLRGTRVNHYTYFLTARNPIDERRYYIGVRSCNGPPNQDACYLSSSKYVKEAILRGVSFDKKILNVFSTRKDAVNDEIRLHEMRGVNLNPEFFNVAKQTTTGWDTTGLPHSQEFKESVRKRTSEMWKDEDVASRMKAKMKRTFNSPEVKSVRSRINKDRYKSSEERKKTSEATRLGCSSQEVREKKSLAMKEVWSRPEHRDKVLPALKEAFNSKEYRKDIS